MKKIYWALYLARARPVPGRIPSVSGFSGWIPTISQKVRTTHASIFKVRKQEIQRGTMPGPGSHSTEVAKQGVDSVWPYRKPNPPFTPNILKKRKKIHMNRKVTRTASRIPTSPIQTFFFFFRFKLFTFGLTCIIYLCVCAQTLALIFCRPICM